MPLELSGDTFGCPGDLLDAPRDDLGGLWGCETGAVGLWADTKQDKASASARRRRRSKAFDAPKQDELPANPAERSRPQK